MDNIFFRLIEAVTQNLIIGWIRYILLAPYWIFIVVNNDDFGKATENCIYWKIRIKTILEKLTIIEYIWAEKSLFLQLKCYCFVISDII